LLFCKAPSSDCSYAQETTTFSVNIIVTLNFDLMTLKSIGVMYRTWLYSLLNFTALGWLILKLLSGNHFQFKGYIDFGLVTPKLIGVFFLIWTIILWGLNSVGQIEFKLCFKTIFSFEVIVTLTSDTESPKSIGVFYQIWTIILWNLNTVGQMDLKLCSRIYFQL
jgi:hypothetical protein